MGEDVINTSLDKVTHRDAVIPQCPQCLGTMIGGAKAATVDMSELFYRARGVTDSLNRYCSSNLMLRYVHDRNDFPVVDLSSVVLALNRHSYLNNSSACNANNVSFLHPTMNVQRDVV